MFVVVYWRFGPGVDSLALEGSTDIPLRNVGKKNYQYTLRNNSDERRPYLHRGERLKSRRF